MKILTTVALVALSMTQATTSLSSPVCAPTNRIFGTIIVSGFAPTTVSLEWTILETPDVTSYRLLRLPALAGPASSSSSGQAPVRIAELRPAGQPVAIERTYQVTDTAPPGVWIYRVEIRQRHGDGCSISTLPISIPDPPPCGTVDVCNHVAESFAGTVILGTVRMQWLTSAENESVREYRLIRSPTGCTGSSCATEVATVNATGSCGKPCLHGLTDAPPSGQWRYRLEVISTSGATACTVDAPELALSQ